MCRYNYRFFLKKIVVTNPGGLYGRININQLGKVQTDTRNPVLATALETLKITENRYSGIPTIRREMKEYNLPDPLFEDKRGAFVVTLFGIKEGKTKNELGEKDLLKYCKIPRTRKEIADYLEIKSIPYALKTYILPLINEGKISLSIPDHPKSPMQKYTTTI